MDDVNVNNADLALIILGNAKNQPRDLFSSNYFPVNWGGGRLCRYGANQLCLLGLVYDVVNSVLLIEAAVSPRVASEILMKTTTWLFENVNDAKELPASTL